MFLVVLKDYVENFNAVFYLYNIVISMVVLPSVSPNFNMHNINHSASPESLVNIVSVCAWFCLLVCSTVEKCCRNNLRLRSIFS